MGSIDLNADTGESYGRWDLGEDEAMFGFISSANVACGFHAGDPLTLQKVCALAVGAGVVLGAQVGYPDLVGFGRRFIDMDADELTAAVIYQIGALDGLARAGGGRVRYVRPHGALYKHDRPSREAGTRGRGGGSCLRPDPAVARPGPRRAGPALR